MNLAHESARGRHSLLPLGRPRRTGSRAHGQTVVRSMREHRPGRDRKGPSPDLSKPINFRVPASLGAWIGRTYVQPSNTAPDSLRPPVNGQRSRSDVHGHWGRRPENAIAWLRSTSRRRRDGEPARSAVGASPEPAPSVAASAIDISCCPAIAIAHRHPRAGVARASRDLSTDSARTRRLVHSLVRDRAATIRSLMVGRSGRTDASTSRGIEAWQPIPRTGFQRTRANHDELRVMDQQGAVRDVPNLGSRISESAGASIRRKAPVHLPMEARTRSDRHFVGRTTNGMLNGRHRAHRRDHACEVPRKGIRRRPSSVDQHLPMHSEGSIGTSPVPLFLTGQQDFVTLDRPLPGSYAWAASYAWAEGTSSLAVESPPTGPWTMAATTTDIMAATTTDELHDSPQCHRSRRSRLCRPVHPLQHRVV
jgi:hypothetical protein